MKKLFDVVCMVLVIIGQVLLIGGGAAVAVKIGRPGYVTYAVVLLLIVGMVDVPVPGRRRRAVLTPGRAS